MRKLQYSLTFAVLILVGCAGSPARMNNQSVQQIQNDLNLPSLSNAELCREKNKSITRLLKITYEQGFNAWGVAGMRKMIIATDQVLTSRGYDKRYCEGGSFANKKNAFLATKKEREIVKGSGELRPGQSFFSVQQGMLRSDVFAFVGAAANTETNGDVKALQYCQTVGTTDFYYSVWMKDGVVVGKSIDQKNKPLITYQVDTSCILRLPKVDFSDYRAESKESVKSNEILLEKEDINTEELVDLGYKYMNGIDVIKDTNEGLRLFRLAAAQGSARAQHNLGWVYQNGYGVPIDINQAVHWYGKALDQGLSASQDNLGRMYAQGAGVKKDGLKAVSLLNLAAEQDNAGAINYLGTMYAQGNGVKKDLRKAVTLYRRAALLGHGWGQTNLGHAYFNGRGLVVNKIYAYVWSDLGAWNGNDTGAKNRDLYMQSMSDNQISIAKELSKKCIRENYVDCF